MNKLVVFAFIAFAVFNIVKCGDSSEEVEAVLQQVKSKHLKKLLTERKDSIDDEVDKLEKKCPGVTEKLKNALKAFEECDDKVDDSLTICAAIQQSAYNCTAPLLQVVSDCLPTEARGLPQLGVKSLVSIADYLCKQTGETIFELANPCIWSDPETPSEEYTKCETKVNGALDKLKDETPSSSSICTTLTDLRGCLVSSANECENPKTKSAIIGLYDAAIAPCSNVNTVD